MSSYSILRANALSTFVQEQESGHGLSRRQRNGVVARSLRRSGESLEEVLRQDFREDVGPGREVREGEVPVGVGRGRADGSARVTQLEDDALEASVARVQDPVAVEVEDLPAADRAGVGRSGGCPVAEQEAGRVAAGRDRDRDRSRSRGRRLNETARNDFGYDVVARSDVGEGEGTRGV